MCCQSGYMAKQVIFHLYFLFYLLIYNFYTQAFTFIIHWQCTKIIFDQLLPFGNAASSIQVYVWIPVRMIIIVILWEVVNSIVMKDA